MRKNLTSLKDFVDSEVGAAGTPKRDEYEAGLAAFKIGFLIQQARRKKGMTQQELATLSGTNKAYISKLENNMKDIRFSTLQRIIKDGLGGTFELSINL